MLSAPGFLWILVLIPPLIYLHLRRRQRPDIVVSSLFLWEGLTGKVQTKFRRKLNRNLHLILQIFIIILFSLTLSNPMLPVGSSPAERTVIVIDGSASMGVMENGKSRFELAISETVSILRERGGINVSVILASSKIELISEFGETTDTQIDKIRKLDFSHTVSNIKGAILKGENLIGGYINSEIVLITDGAFDMDPLQVESDFPIKFITIGSQNTNIGITSIKSRKDPASPNVHHIFINIQNNSDMVTETDLIIYVNGNEYNRIPLIIPENKSLSTVQVVSDVSGKLEVVLDVNDPYPLDDRAYMILETGRPVSVLLITDGNFYLESLLSISDEIELTVTKDQPDSLDYDIVVFDKPPGGIPGPGNYIFFGSVPKNYNMEYDEIVDFPGIKSWKTDHPVLQDVDPLTFSVYQTIGTRAGKEFTSILEGEVPLIYTSKNSNFKSVYFTFILNASNLVLKPAFPLLINNTIKWMLPNLKPASLKSEQAGKLIQQRKMDSSVVLNSLSGEMINSSGEVINLSVINNSCSFTPDRTGFYKLRVFGKEYEYAVNLISSEESDISSRFSLPDLNTKTIQDNPESFYSIRSILIFLILAIMVFELMQTKKRREGAGLIGKLQLGLAFISIMLLILVFTNISIFKEKTESTVIFLLDISRSISRENKEAALNWISFSQPKAEENIKTGFVVFGESAKVIKAPGPGLLDLNSIILPESEESNLEVGLDQACALLPGHGDNRIVVLTDGNETKGNITESIKSMGNIDIKISTVPLSGLSYGNEIIARSIMGPSMLSMEEYISFTLEIESYEESIGNIFFYLDGEYYGEDSITIYSGRTMLSYRVNLKKPGYHLFEAVIESDNDIIFENNKFQKMVFIEGRPPVLYVHNGAGPSDMLIGPLKAHGFSFDVISAARFPDTLNELFSYDSVILDNIPAYYFSIAKMEMLREAVSSGLGLFVIGGDNSLGAGGYYNTPLEKAIPVDVDITSSLDLPGTALVMVIDNSGSMQDAVSKNKCKNDLAKQAVYSALKVLDPDDTAGILAFNADFEWVVEIEPELDMESVREKLFPLSPGGGTVLLPALEEAYRVLNSTSASVKHILILSDGYTDSEGFESLLNNIRNSGITVSTVAVGSDSNQKLMENIAAWGRGRNYYTDDIRSVPSIFVSETLKASRQLFVEETFFPTVNQPHEILIDIIESEIPPLHGFMLTYPKPNSEILLKGPGNNPLLSVWQYGLGRSAVFTSNLSSSWSYDWALWESSNLIFTHILRWVSRGDPDKGLKLSLSHNRSTIYIEVDARDENEEYLNGLKLSARVILPDFSEIPVELIQDAAGLYKGEFPVSLDGNYFVTVKDRNLNTSFISVPYPEEYRNMRPSIDLLNSIRTLTNGEKLSLANPLTSEFYIIDPESKAAKSNYWQFFILLGLILFFISVVFRLQNPGTIAAPFVKFAAFIINLLTGKPVISYSNFRKKMEKIRSEQERSKHSQSFWFGKNENTEDKDKIYISKKIQ